MRGNLDIRATGFDFLQNAQFLKRKGIEFYWGGPLFTGVNFGTRVGPINDVFSGTLHDLSHCIDFVQRKKTRQITARGLVFRTPWQTWNDYLNCYDGFPATAEHIHCEARTLAIQAWLQYKLAGVTYLSDIRYNDVTTLREVSVEEWFADQGELVKWFDTYVFQSEEGIKQMEYRERQEELKIRFSNLISHYYNEISEKSIKESWTAAAAKIRYNQKRPEEYKLRVYTERDLIVAF